MPALSRSTPVETDSRPLGLLGAWRRFWAETSTEGQIIRTLFRRNYVHRFAGSGLGFAWVIIMPCLPVFIYNVLQVMGVFADPGTGIPRAVFMSTGLILYYSFSEALQGVASSTVENGRYIVQSGVPKMAIILAAVSEVLANLAIRFAVVLVLILAMYGPPPLTVVLLPLFALPLALLGLGAGLLLNLFCVLYQDLLNLIRVITFYLLFASGVFTAIPDNGIFYAILRISPVYQLVSGGRAAALEGDFTTLPQDLLVAVVCILTIPFAIVAFYRAEKLVNTYL